MNDKPMFHPYSTSIRTSALAPVALLKCKVEETMICTTAMDDLMRRIFPSAISPLISDAEN